MLNIVTTFVIACNRIGVYRRALISIKLRTSHIDETARGRLTSFKNRIGITIIPACDSCSGASRIIYLVPGFLHKERIHHEIIP